MKITLLLYLGPLYELLLDMINGHQSFEIFERWKFIRNIIVAPIVEELVFRSYLLQPLQNCLPILPLFFGLAHLHHYISNRNLGDFLLQFAYTSLFGAYSCWILVESKSLVGCILAHSFCNFMGLPFVEGRYWSWFVSVFGCILFVYSIWVLV